MKTKHLLLLPVMLMLTAATSFAQDATNKHLSAKDDIPFGKKLPLPDLTGYPGKSLPQAGQPSLHISFVPGTHRPDINAIKKNLANSKQQQQNNRKGETEPAQQNAARVFGNNSNGNSDFHLTKDINALAESNPDNHTELNYPDVGVNNSYAILDHVMYFAADDGIHGKELWRSDGTAAGTFMVKDIEPGAASSNPYEITEAHGKIYFSAFTSSSGGEPWVSDGTESGTQVLVVITPNPAYSSSPAEFTALGNKTYFAASVNDYLDALWETDGTPAGTKMIKSLAIDPGGFLISQMMEANGLLYFTFISYTTGAYELWRSDGTDAGTYHIGTNYFFYNNFPLQLTSYNNKLYFSADSDGTGSKLWLTDGTDAGTIPAPGNNDVSIVTDYFGTTFPVLDNVLYIPGFSATGVGGLYKYDPTTTDGVQLVRDLTHDASPVFIVPSQMTIANHILYFKVSNSNGGVHDELWRSRGTKESTQKINSFLPGETINNLYSASDALYFVKYDKSFGTELWKIPDTRFGTLSVLVSDIFKGATGSYPSYLTAFKGKLFFSATDESKGNELFMTNDFGFGATVVKDINTVSTSSSYAGYYVNTITPLVNNVIFRGYEKVHGNELYKSDGTEKGTDLLNDIIPGEASSNGYNFLTKNNAAYFIAQSSDTTNSIFKTNGTRSGLQKVVPDYNIYPQYFIGDFKVADNGLIFYVLFNYHTYTYELWRSNGTNAGTFLLSSTLSYSYNLNIVGNTAFFGGGDATNGYELWKSDGSITGTGIVKDINPGPANSNPIGMFIYKNQVYFAADNVNGPSFWKSDGTNTGTIQLAQIDPWYYSSVFSTARYSFEVSNNILYFAAIDYTNSNGTQVWRTDGTPAGTYALKDISPNANSFYPFPSYFTDVNGTLFFIGDDEVNGRELWKSDGTATGTQLVKDITPGIDPSSLGNLVSFAGKLFFTNSGVLWSSDGTPEGTIPVNNEVISKVNVSNIVATSDQLFLSGYTYKYGIELYAGRISAKTELLTISKTSNLAEKANESFNATLYPNPALSNVTLQLTGNTKNVSISIADISGKKLWQGSSSNVTQIHLPTEKYAAGIYVVTVTSDTDRKTIRLVKQ